MPMSVPSRLGYLDQILRSGQTSLYQSKYSEPFGLFLDENETFEVEAIVSKQDTQRQAQDDEDPSTSPGTLTNSSDPLSDLDYATCGFNGYHRLILRSSADVTLTCNGKKGGFMMVYIKQVEHSRSPFRLTRSCFEQLVQSVGMFSAIKDIVLHAGNRNAELEVAPPCLRSSHLVDETGQLPYSTGHEVAYGLRYMQHNGRSLGKPWSLRQFFVYNKSHYHEESSQWVIFSLPDVIRIQVDEYLQIARGEATSHPLEIHTLFYTYVIRMWRPYFVEMSERIEIHKRRIESTDLTDKNSVQELGGSMLGVLKSTEMDLLDAILALRATMDTIKRIDALFSNDLYLGRDTKSSEHQQNQSIMDSVASNSLRDLGMLINQAMSLSQKVQSLSVLHANFLNLGNGFSLQTLAQQQTEESEQMRELTNIATRDTKAVKTLSIITLIYLPITVVLNFFSTVFFDNGNGDVQVIGHWWLLVAVSVPLTALTIFVWLVCVFRGHVKPRQPRSRGMKDINSMVVKADYVKVDAEKIMHVE